MRAERAVPLPQSAPLADPRSMSERVADALRDAIRSGELADGTELNQIALAAHFGISRVPVREAMRQLQAEGWIHAEKHQRAVVRGLTAERILEVLELRAVLEAHLVAKAVPKMTEPVLAELRAICGAMSRAGDHRRWLELNREFHRTLYQPSGCVTTIELLEQLTSQVERYVRGRGARIAREREALREHRAILDAVRTKDVREAQRLVRLHVEHTANRFHASTPPTP